jgi:hypothetical protein
MKLRTLSSQPRTARAILSGSKFCPHNEFSFSCLQPNVPHCTVCSGFNFLRCQSLRIRPKERALPIPNALRACLFVWHVPDHRARYDHSVCLEREYGRDRRLIRNSQYADSARCRDRNFHVAEQRDFAAFACSRSGPVQYGQRHRCATVWHLSVHWHGNVR